MKEHITLGRYGEVIGQETERELSFWMFSILKTNQESKSLWLPQNYRLINGWNLNIIQNLPKINSSKEVEQINLNPFNFFNDQDQDMRDPGLNYFNDIS